MSGLIRMQVFYEIAMEIGTEADLQKSSKKALSMYLHKLGCSAGMIIRADLAGDPGRLESVVTVPRNLAHNCTYKEVSARIHGAVSMGGVKHFLDSLPLSGTVDGTNYYIMELEDFGVLLLIKSGEPFDQAILHGITRLNYKLGQACLAGLYTARLEAAVQERTKDLQETNNKLTESLANIKTLNGLLPICAGCKKIRDDKGYWNQIETYVSNHSQAVFTHGLCPVCIQRLYPKYAEEEGEDERE